MRISLMADGRAIGKTYSWNVEVLPEPTPKPGFPKIRPLP